MIGETNCQCGCGMVLQEKTTRFLQDLDVYSKAILHKQIIITSGARCKKHNNAVGGVENSTHTLGLAVDIAFASSHELFVIMQFCFGYGVKRMGINFAKSFIHIDFGMGDFAQQVIFKY